MEVPWDVRPGRRFLVQSVPLSQLSLTITLLSNEITSEYLLEEKEIDVVEELEHYSLMISR